MASPRIGIYDLMACNVYVDYTKVKKREQHKFLVSFYPIKGFLPDYIESITAYGPNGYKVEFKNQEYSAKTNVNGYILDKAFNSCWYMVNLDTGFMEAGEYRIEVITTDGKKVETSRIQKNGPTEELLQAYLDNHKEIYDSYNPSESNRIPDGTPLKNLNIKWKGLKEVADQDAYYIWRVSLGERPWDFNIQKLVWWDNVFVDRYKDDKAGFNISGVTIPKELKPKTSYAYFTETTNSNAMGQTDICIFQPHRCFVTPAA